MVDLVGCALAILIVVSRILWRGRLELKPVFELRDTITDFMTATAIVPFLLMLGTAFSERFTQELIGSSKGTIWIAGGVGLLYILRELVTKPKASIPP